MEQKSIYDQIVEDMRSSDKREPAGFGLRFLSLFLDIAIVGFITDLLGSSIYPSNGIGFNIDGTGFIVLAIYYLIFDWSPLRGTPPKYFLGLSVTDEYGARLSFSKSALRFISRAVTFFTLFIGFFIVLFRDDSRALHDIMSSTYVLKNGNQ